jgi:hypothetical protein
MKYNKHRHLVIDGYTGNWRYSAYRREMTILQYRFDDLHTTKNIRLRNYLARPIRKSKGT